MRPSPFSTEQMRLQFLSHEFSGAGYLKGDLGLGGSQKAEIGSQGVELSTDSENAIKNTNRVDPASILELRAHSLKLEILTQFTKSEQNS